MVSPKKEIMRALVVAPSWLVAIVLLMLPVAATALQLPLAGLPLAMYAPGRRVSRATVAPVARPGRGPKRKTAVSVGDDDPSQDRACTSYGDEQCRSRRVTDAVQREKNMMWPRATALAYGSNDYKSGPKKEWFSFCKARAGDYVNGVIMGQDKPDFTQMLTDIHGIESEQARHVLLTLLSQIVTGLSLSPPSHSNACTNGTNVTVCGVIVRPLAPRGARHV